MRYFYFSSAVVLVVFVPQFLFAATVTFSVAPSSVPSDGAVIIEAMIQPDLDESAINALEGRIGILGVGSEAVTDVILETGDSVFSLWPELPRYDENERMIRFTGGVPETLSDGGLILRMRLFTTASAPITLSWLGGSAYAADGFGTSVGITSRSLVVTPKAGEPNLMSATSQDAEPPTIESLRIAQDPDVFEGKYFLSVLATDDTTGISHYEVLEGGVTTRVENGPYVLIDQRQKEPLLVIVYDKAGNSVSMKVPGAPEWYWYFVIGLLIGVGVIGGVLFRFRTNRK